MVQDGTTLGERKVLFSFRFPTFLFCFKGNLWNSLIFSWHCFASSNIQHTRMSLETILIMGISMGRTIVLPPAKRIYLFNKAKHKHHFTFRDFFRLEDAEIEHYHIKFISMEEYLEKVAMKGLLFDQNVMSSREVLFPPDNRTDWNQANNNMLQKLWKYIRKTSYEDKICKPVDKFISYFPDNTTDLGPESQHNFMSLIQNLKTQGFNRNMYNGNPPPVNASEIERLREHYFRREKVCFYDNQMQNALTVHYKFEWNGNRFLLPFYTFHFFQNWKQELWTKRFIRDHLRYNDELMCAAARIIARIREDAKTLSPENKHGLFNTMHIRRGDFKQQYKQTMLSAEDTYEKSKKYLQNHTSNILYIATDEKNLTFFEPLQRAHHVVLLSNYSHLIQDINPNYQPLIEQLVLARGDVFVGTMYSTYTSYVNRLRGYYSWRDRLPGYDKGTIQSHYLRPATEKYQQYFSIHDPMWAFEFPEAWYDIDHDVEY